MPNRKLNHSELAIANKLLSEIRRKLQALSGDDASLLWAMRRKVTKELGYDERGKPMARRKLKDSKWKSQRGLCAVCNGNLPEKNSILDRIEAMRGYTAENTRLLCVTCDTRTQVERGYA